MKNKRTQLKIAALIIVHIALLVFSEAYDQSTVSMKIEMADGKRTLYGCEPVAVRVKITNNSSEPIHIEPPRWGFRGHFPLIEVTDPGGTIYQVASGDKHPVRIELKPGETAENVFDISGHGFLKGKKPCSDTIKYFLFSDPGEYTIKGYYMNYDDEVMVSSNSLNITILEIPPNVKPFWKDIAEQNVAILISNGNEPGDTGVPNVEKIKPELENVIDSPDNILTPYAHFLYGICLLHEKERLKIAVVREVGEIRTDLKEKGLSESEISDYFIEHHREMKKYHRPVKDTLREATLVFEKVEKEYPGFPLRENLRYILYEECYTELMAQDPGIRDRARQLMRKMVEEDYAPNVKSPLNQLIKDNKHVLVEGNEGE